LQCVTVHSSAGHPNLFWVREEQLPEALVYLGEVPPTPAASVMGSGVGYSDWEAFIMRMTSQHRHEEEQGLAPVPSEAEPRARVRAAATYHATERRRQALENLADTFEGEEDEEIPGFRQILSETLAGLLELGPDGDEVAKLDLLRLCVERFNASDTHIDTYF